MRNDRQWTKAGLTESQNRFSVARKRMIHDQILPAGVKDTKVLEAMSRVPRHEFVENGFRDLAYLDRPLSIGNLQTISQPVIVALMTEALELTGKERILEIGTGSGYQTAILLEIGCQVFSIERISSLSNRARKALYSLGYTNFKLRIGDGTEGWPDEACFDRIVVTAGSPQLPKTFLEQLGDGGIIVIPVGDSQTQELKRIRRMGDVFKEDIISDCRFVKLIGKHGWAEN